VFWLAYQTRDGICVVLQPAASLIHAKLAVDVQNLTPGEFTEGHQLDAKLIKRIPKKLIGKVLSAKEAEQLLTRL
jgi:hypothetical protein